MSRDQVYFPITATSASMYMYFVHLSFSTYPRSIARKKILSVIIMHEFDACHGYYCPFRTFYDIGRGGCAYEDFISVYKVARR